MEVSDKAVPGAGERGGLRPSLLYQPEVISAAV